jgi:predicted phage tail protein
MEDIGRAKIIQVGNKWTVIIDKPSDPPVAYTFSAGNIIPDTFQWQGFEDPELIDAVELSYWDKDKRFKKRTVFKPAYWYDTLDSVPRVAQIQQIGCNNKEQAERNAILQLQKTEMIGRHGQLEAIEEAVCVEIGDVVAIVHSSNLYGFGGRLARDCLNATEVYIDQVVNMPSADYSGKAKMFLVGPEGINYSCDVLGPFDVDTQWIEISAATPLDDPDAVPVLYSGFRDDTFAIGRPTEEKLYYRVMSKQYIPATEENAAKVAITFVEYVPALYYHADYDSGTVPI